MKVCGDVYLYRNAVTFLIWNRLMILTYGDSQIGLVRKLNEDAINLSVPHLFILADGMGGYAGGQVASAIAVKRVVDFFSGERKEPFSEESLRKSILAANEAILEDKKGHPELGSMGTTMVIGAVDFNHFYWAHVGDSRLYVWHDGILKQVTTDHSFVMELVTEGKISKEEMRVHPRKNEITRAVGIDSALKVDTGSLSLEDGSMVLLCSDGLTGMVDDEEICHLISISPRNTESDLKALGDRLIKKVYDAGARDNVSLILVWYKDVE